MNGYDYVCGSVRGLRSLSNTVNYNTKWTLPLQNVSEMIICCSCSLVFTIENSHFPLKSSLGHPWEASSQIPLREYPDLFQITTQYSQGYTAKFTLPRLRSPLPRLRSQGYVA